jgi:hypothetical protein
MFRIPSQLFIRLQTLSARFRVGIHVSGMVRVRACRDWRWVLSFARSCSAAPLLCVSIPGRTMIASSIQHYIQTRMCHKYSQYSSPSPHPQAAKEPSLSSKSSSFCCVIVGVDLRSGKGQRRLYIGVGDARGCERPRTGRVGERWTDRDGVGEYLFFGSFLLVCLSSPLVFVT